MRWIFHWAAPASARCAPILHGRVDRAIATHRTASAFQDDHPLSTAGPRRPSLRLFPVAELLSTVAGIRRVVRQ